MCTPSLSINPALSPPPFSAFSSPSYKYTPTVFSSKFYCFCASRTRIPICQICVKAKSLKCERSIKNKELRILKVRSSSERPSASASTSSNMTIREYTEEEEEENPPPLLESEMNSRPRRIALFVEPSPFA